MAFSQGTRESTLLLEAEAETGLPIHKGAPLYNLGMALIATKEELEGLKNIVSALVEDLISEESEKIVGAPAWQFLLSRGVPEGQLGHIGEFVTQSIRGKEDALHTDAVVQSLFEDLRQYFGEQEDEMKAGAVPPEGILQAYDISISGSFDDRVFVGGSYRNIALLRKICDIIGDMHKQKFMPILVAELTSGKDVADEDIHHLCMRILDECRHAVFEVSVPDGALMEIEHCHQMNLDDPGTVKVVLLWQARTEEQEERPPISAMLMTREFERNPYTSLDNLRFKIEEFLK